MPGLLDHADELKPPLACLREDDVAEAHVDGEERNIVDSILPADPRRSRPQRFGGCRAPSMLIPPQVEPDPHVGIPPPTIKDDETFDVADRLGLVQGWQGRIRVSQPVEFSLYPATHRHCTGPRY
jgi:hypothetical protein